MLIDTGFEKLLGPYGAELDAEGGSVVGLWPDGRIGLLNQAWRRFALDNGGAVLLERWPLGSDHASAISGVLREYYERAFERVRQRGEPWEQTYLCDAPSRHREFRLRVLPLERRALLLVHSLVVDALRPGQGSPDPSFEYVRSGGMLRQCSNCRRTERTTGRAGWDWVRAYVANPPENVEHAICPTCALEHYPGL